MNSGFDYLAKLTRELAREGGNVAEYKALVSQLKLHERREADLMFVWGARWGEPMAWYLDQLGDA